MFVWKSTADYHTGKHCVRKIGLVLKVSSQSGKSRDICSDGLNSLLGYMSPYFPFTPYSSLAGKRDIKASIVFTLAEAEIQSYPDRTGVPRPQCHLLRTHITSDSVTKRGPTPTHKSAFQSCTQCDQRPTIRIASHAINCTPGRTCRGICYPATCR